MRTRVILGLCAAVLAVLLPGAAQAVAPVAAPAQYCVLHLSQGGSKSCYSTFTEAIADGTNGKVADAPRDALTAQRDPSFAAKLNRSATAAPAPGARANATLAGGTVVGIEYMHIGWAFPAAVIEVDHGCTWQLTDVDWQSDLWGNWYWNDEISSFQVYANCLVRHFDLPAFQGDRTPYQPSEYYIGDWMNDRTSSIQWS